jgi:hypothetical protein
MPGLDQTGPIGQGSMTGRRMGRCTNYASTTKKNEDTGQNENLAEKLPGRGFGGGQRRAGIGRGRGKGLGRQNRFRGSF